MPSSICAAVKMSSETQNGRVVSRSMARDPTMLLTAYHPLALTQFKRAGRYAPRVPKLWRVNESCGMPICGPILAVIASSAQPMILPTIIAATPSAKPSPKTTASAPTSQTGKPILAESQSVNNVRGLPCRSLAETCSIPCGSTASTCPRYSLPDPLPASTGFSNERILPIAILLCRQAPVREQRTGNTCSQTAKRAIPVSVLFTLTIPIKKKSCRKYSTCWCPTYTNNLYQKVYPEIREKASVFLTLSDKFRRRAINRGLRGSWPHYFATIQH